MAIVGFIVCFHFILMVIYFLYKKYNAPFVILFSGIGLLAISWFMGAPYTANELGNELLFFHLFAQVRDSFVQVLSDVGIMIMIIGGFVAYMRSIGASDALVFVSLQPLSIFRRYPYIAAMLVIPIGQILFMAIPSATGLGILLVATIFPVLVNMGISRVSAVSIITVCTVFDMGPGSFNTGAASELIGKQHLSYFIEDQLPLTIPLTLVLMALMYFCNKYFDKKEGHVVQQSRKIETELKVPLIYAVFPLLPIIFLLCYAIVNSITGHSIKLETATAMLASVFVALFFELIRKKRMSEIVQSFSVFWRGMGNMFTTVIVLIAATNIFTKGLISAGFIEGLLQLTIYMGLGSPELGTILTALVFTTAILTGSGSASFNAFAPQISILGLNSGVTSFILPMQLASSLGRAISPISGVVIASSEIAKISSFRLARRNVLPLTVIFIILLLYFYLRKKAGIL